MAKGFIQRLFDAEQGERALQFLERIADALDRISPPIDARRLIKRVPPKESALSVIDDEELCRREEEAEAKAEAPPAEEMPEHSSSSPATNPRGKWKFHR